MLFPKVEDFGGGKEVWVTLTRDSELLLRNKPGLVFMAVYDTPPCTCHALHRACCGEEFWPSSLTLQSLAPNLL